MYGDMNMRILSGMEIRTLFSVTDNSRCKIITFHERKMNNPNGMNE
jgi:hypothetical protein